MVFLAELHKHQTSPRHFNFHPKNSTPHSNLADVLYKLDMKALKNGIPGLNHLLLGLYVVSDTVSRLPYLNIPLE